MLTSGGVYPNSWKALSGGTFTNQPTLSRSSRTSPKAQHAAPDWLALGQDRRAYANERFTARLLAEARRLRAISGSLVHGLNSGSGMRLPCRAETRKGVRSDAHAPFGKQGLAGATLTEAWTPKPPLYDQMQAETRVVRLPGSRHDLDPHPPSWLHRIPSTGRDAASRPDQAVA